MGLRKLLDAGLLVMGSRHDGQVKNLADMSSTSLKRQGYADENGNWTDRGFDRATTKDYAVLEKSRQSRIKSGK
ncbi:hypothetical protein [Glaciimonas soli]|uniref:Uncharacterized protein n=1 Tax=Glaciimonas soli TaxID=2590999 RepID=A0A843YTX7_9BURK|nr:hypothetical protein [Glaciimonas soli]MQR00958.1 hypothetical protein [Glaciimonas soli]